MTKKIQSFEVNKALKDLDKEIKSVTGVMNIQTIYQYTKQQNLKIKELEKQMCVYAREHITGIDFYSDDCVLGYFADEAEKHK